MTLQSLVLPRDLSRFAWLNEPPAHRLSGGALEVMTGPQTDFWQRPQDGIRRDNGHLLAVAVAGDFTLVGRVTWRPVAQYDQCGFMVRVDEDAWIKCAVEYEAPDLARLGSVVTNGGSSDWATQDVSGDVNEMWYRIRRVGAGFTIDCGRDGAEWHMIRDTPLPGCPDQISVGFYACSPTGDGFSCRLESLSVELPAAARS